MYLTVHAAGKASAAKMVHLSGLVIFFVIKVFATSFEHINELATAKEVLKIKSDLLSRKQTYARPTIKF